MVKKDNKKILNYKKNHDNYLLNRDQRLNYSRQYYQIHRAQILKRVQKYSQIHKTQIKERCKKWRESHYKERSEYSRKWRLIHKDYSKEQSRKWHLTHKDHAREYAKKWYWAHRDHCLKRAKKYKDYNREYARKWYWEHRDHCLERAKKYRFLKGITKKHRFPKIQNNIIDKKKLHTKYMRNWRRKNRAKTTFQRQKDKYNRKNAGPLLIQTIQRVYEENIKVFGTLTCIYCFSSIQFGNDSLEHVIPITKGGTNEYENLAIACRRCNTSKGNKTLEEFFKETEV